MGFYAKLSVLQAVLGTGQIWLAVLAVMLSLIGAFYYLRAIWLMYFEDAVDTSPIVVSKDMGVVLSINGIAVLVLGLMPGALMNACAVAIVKTLAS
jgi:NADH-quinone oxidoreductase subunit N